MYSVVLMMAMTTGGEMPAFHKGGGCRGGCYGGGCYGGRMRHQRHRRGGGGCGCSGGGYGGGCYGGGWGGGYGGCYGGGYGGGWGGGCYGGGMYSTGCYGGGYGAGMYSAGCYGGGLGGGYGGCYGGGGMPGYYGAPGTLVPGGVTPPPEDLRKMPRPDKGKEEASLAAPATIVVTLPADAKLSIDGAPTTSTSDRRVFVSPNLPPGREFHYTLKAEVVRNGKPVQLEKQVTVRAGTETQVNLTPPASVARR